MGGKFSFNPTERSELFWLTASGIAYQDILFYNCFPENPVPAPILEQLNDRGIRVYGVGEGLVEWKSTSTLYKTLFRVLVKIIVYTTRCLLNGHWVSPYYVIRLMALARDYAYWYDFYYTNRVKIDICAMKMTVGQVLALDSLNGISLAYQYSIANFFPLVGLSSGETVQFLMSRDFKRLWQGIDAPVRTFVETGFIYDGVFQVNPNSENIAITRKQFQKRNVNFILCFFDESSNHRWDVPDTHESAAKNYEFLLNWLLDDPSLGIVFKPKRAKDLFQRMAAISDLIQRALDSGRCRFLMGETSVGSIFPAEAASMADVCIGMLNGATATLEAQLAGVPSVLIDVHGLHYHPFYNWGMENLIFKSWDALRSALERYRASKESIPEFGDWSPVLKRLDPYRDGRATVRMGSYIRWIHDALHAGETKENALKYASETFEKRWGKEHIAFGYHSN